MSKLSSIRILKNHYISYVYKTTTLLSFLVLTIASFGQCNGSLQNCGKTYDQVAYLTTHNAYNAFEEGHYWENQTHGVSQQLNDGVRAFMFDLYMLNDTVVQYHGISGLGYRPFSDDLSKIKLFLDNNPNEVLTIILESYVTATDVENEMLNAGLTSYLHTHDPSSQWWTLQQMIDSNQRLIIFSDVDDAILGQNWCHYVWDYAVETNFSVHDTSEFTHDFNRGNPTNDLFIFNHFVTSPTFSIGEPTKAPYVNEHDFLSNRIIENYSLHQKFANFITLDFYHIGDGMQVVEELNSGQLSIFDHDSELFKIVPNPSNGIIAIYQNSGLNYQEFQLFSTNGRYIQSFDLSNGNSTLDLTNFESGIYLYRIIQSDKIMHTGKIILQ